MFEWKMKEIVRRKRHNNLPLGKICAEKYPSLHCFCLPSTKEVANLDLSSPENIKMSERIRSKNPEESSLTRTPNKVVKIISDTSTVITEWLVACHL